MEDWSFFTAAGNSGNLRLVVAAWDGSKAIGPALYSSAINYAGGTQTLTFSGINVDLNAGTYISYLTTSGLSGAVTNVVTKGSNDDGGLGGNFRFLNSSDMDPLTLGGRWSAWSTPNMQFAATISAPVPEPEIYAMMGIGLGFIGWFSRRREQQVA